jgi:hypothetical protein
LPKNVGYPDNEVNPVPDPEDVEVPALAGTLSPVNVNASPLHIVTGVAEAEVIFGIGFTVKADVFENVQPPPVVAKVYV